MWHPCAEIHDRHGSPQPDVAIAALAERQYGVVSLAQLRALGLGRGAIEHRIGRNRKATGKQLDEELDAIYADLAQLMRAGV